MFSSKTICDTIEIAPKALNAAYKKEIFTLISKKFSGSVSKSFGAIINVTEIETIENPVCKNSKLISQIFFKALTFKPEINEIYTGKITLILHLGLMIQIDSIIKIIIQPINMPPNYEFSKERKVFTNKIHSYGVGDTIKFKIVNIKYKTNELNCIGSVKDILENITEDILEPIDEFVEESNYIEE